jgi:hypothetical protein
MKPELQRRSSRRPGSSHTTAGATPTLSAAITSMTAGAALDDLVGRAVLGWGPTHRGQGLSTSWEGTRKLVGRLTSLGCSVQLQIQADRTVCQVLRVLDGAAVAKLLAQAEAAEAPEAVAKAAAIACLQMQPHPE